MPRGRRPSARLLNRLSGAALFLALLLSLAMLRADAQQKQYEWVPGSRQARWVNPANNQTTSQYQRQYYQGRQPGYPAYPQSQGSGSMRQTAVQAQPQPQSVQSRSAQPAAQTASAQDFSDTVNVGGVERSYLIHVPRGYDSKRSYPLVMAFHGLGMNGQLMYGMSGLTGVADRKGFVVVFPNAQGGRWQDGLTAGNDDVSYVEAMLAKLSRTVNIDSRRVYACGISNGGYFTQLLSLSIPEKIAACAVVASTLTRGGANCAGGRSVPIVFFLGTEDPLIPWDDGRKRDLGKLGEVLGIGALGSLDGPLAKMGGLNSAPETIDFWINHNGASGNPRVSQEPDSSPRDGTRVEKQVFGSGASSVVLYKIVGGGHTWPGCLNLRAISDISGPICQDIDASETMWEFFRNFSR